MNFLFDKHQHLFCNINPSSANDQRILDDKDAAIKIGELFSGYNQVNIFFPYIL